MENPAFLYHLTSEMGKNRILSDMEIKPIPFAITTDEEKLFYDGYNTFFADNVEACKALAPCYKGEKIAAAYMKNSLPMIEKIAKCLPNRYMIKEITPKFFVFKIPVEWIGETQKRKSKGLTEYIHPGEVKLPEIPEMEIIQLETYKIVTKRG